LINPNAKTNPNTNLIISKARVRKVFKKNEEKLVPQIKMFKQWITLNRGLEGHVAKVNT